MIMRNQIKDLFTDPQKVMQLGLWLSGYENEGEFMTWHRNGQLKLHRFYKNGKKHGESKKWYEDGKVYFHVLYINDKVVRDLNDNA